MSLDEATKGKSPIFLIPERGAMGFVAGSSDEPAELFVIGPPESTGDILFGNAGCCKVKHDGRKQRGQPNSLVHSEKKIPSRGQCRLASQQP
jgi:hypothetical protein